MANWLQKKLLEGWIVKARSQVMSKLGAMGDEIDGASILLLDMFLWCSVFYATDNRLGLSPINRRDERVEMVLGTLKVTAQNLLRRRLTNDDLLEWSRVIGVCMGHFDRYITSVGGTLALCKPVFSLCMRPVMSEVFFDRIFPSPSHVRAFDLAAAHGAVYLLNSAGRLNAFSVVDQTSEEMNLEHPDVFISYGSASRDIALIFADSLNHLRIATWVDRDIPATTEFARTIDGRIQTAKVVLALWTHASVQSRWVQAEALFGFNMDRLVSVRLEPCKLPVPFNAVQAINWPAPTAPSLESWARLLGVIGPMLVRPGLAEYVAASLIPAELERWKSKYPDDPLARSQVDSARWTE